AGSLARDARAGLQIESAPLRCIRWSIAIAPVQSRLMRHAVSSMLLGLLLVICAAGARAADRSLTVFAAASLTDVLQEVGAAYTARTAESVRFSFAGSATLARQIEAGAPADVFVSADQQWMD